MYGNSDEDISPTSIVVARLPAVVEDMFPTSVAVVARLLAEDGRDRASGMRAGGFIVNV